MARRRCCCRQNKHSDKQRYQKKNASCVSGFCRYERTYQNAGQERCAERKQHHRRQICKFKVTACKRENSEYERYCHRSNRRDYNRACKRLAELFSAVLYCSCVLTAVNLLSRVSRVRFPGGSPTIPLAMRIYAVAKGIFCITK